MRGCCAEPNSVSRSLLDPRRPKGEFYFAGVTDGGAGPMRRALPMGQNQTTIATTTTQNQNHRRRVCLLGCTRKLSVQLAGRIKVKAARTITPESLLIR